MTKSLVLFFIGLSIILAPATSFSQGVAISMTGDSNDPSAILDVMSSNQGLLFPRMSDAQRDAIINPATGLIIYCATSNVLNYYNGSNWQEMQFALAPIPIGFISEWITTADGESITLPLSNGNSSTFDCLVDWGDGSPLSTITTYNDADRIHSYATTGTYQIEITGTCEGWSFNGSGDCLKITKVLDWGNINKFSGFAYLSDGFEGCTNLTSLASGGIKCTNHTVLNFKETFKSCTSLVSIPADLFDNNTLLSTYGFLSTFEGCSSLTFIPSGLFDNNTQLSTMGFSSTFSGCSSLVSIPSGLFDHNTLVSSSGFGSIFAYCSSLTSIPSGLFDHNTLVSSHGFSGTFYNCSSLATIPAELFRFNTAVTESGFSQTFYGCSNLQLNRNIFFADGEEGTRFLDQSVSFYRCFYRNSFTGIQGEAPELWNCDFGTGTPTSNDCYVGSGNSTSSLSNYGSIPAEWK